MKKIVQILCIYGLPNVPAAATSDLSDAMVFAPYLFSAIRINRKNSMISKVFFVAIPKDVAHNLQPAKWPSKCNAFLN
jgi:hypothetical protein